VRGFGADQRRLPVSASGVSSLKALGEQTLKIPHNPFVSYYPQIGTKPPSLQVKGLDYAFNGKTLFDNLDFQLSKGSKVTLVGENGCGKSTFLKVLSGKNLVYSGTVSRTGIIGYLPQHFEDLRDETPALFHMLSVGNKVTDTQIDAHAVNRFSKTWYQNLQAEGAYPLFQEIAKIGLDQKILERPFRTLSGGQKTKAILSALAWASPDTLLLDEPTNHLDMKGLNWLEMFLKKRFEGSVVMVTHDRKLINDVSDRISELCPRTKSFVHFKGGYKNYLEEQEKERLRALQKRQVQEKTLGILDQKVDKLTQGLAKGVKRPPSDSNKLSFNAHGERHQKGTSSQVNRSKKQMERIADVLVDVPLARESMNFSFLKTSELPATLSVTNLTMGYAAPLFQDLSFNLSPGEQLILQGPNGSGKTTLLKILAGLVPPQSGEVVWSGSTRIGYLDQEQENLPLDKTAFELLWDDELNTLSQKEVMFVLHKFGIFTSHDLETPLKLLSTGLRRKAQLCHIVMIKKPTILLLDEPTNHIDFPSLEVIENSLQTFPGLIISATHDRTFVDKMSKARVLHLSS
jgi:ATPase subunit of ABC transporter with duplicated ATPase domains